VGDRVGPVFGWLLRDAWRHLGPRELTESFVRLLRAEDPDLIRLFVGVYIVHPLVRAAGYCWENGANDGAVGEFDAPHSAAPSPDWLTSPMRPLFEDGLPEVRIDMGDPEAIAPYPLLQRLRGLGATDYLALPMPYGNRVDVMAVTTGRPSGFDPALVDDLRRTAPLLGRLYAMHGLNRTAHTLLDTYIGPHAAERVFYGQVKRGDGEDIRAAIWFCDLRSFTQHSERLPRGELIRLLNDYFSMITDAVRRNGGEVLKFIGDAVLAIFPIGLHADVRAVCQAAYRAAQDARIAVDAFNMARRIHEAPEIDFGISLHIGDVLYGNIGAPDRLDFTVIGPAVNLVTRMESLCAQLGEPILLSGAFVDAAGIPAAPIGPFPLKGIAEPQMVYVAGPRPSRR
jgi:adenylate cyclase